MKENSEFGIQREEWEEELWIVEDFMGKKKREHIVFDRMLKQKNRISLKTVNRKCGKGKKKGK